MDSAETISLGIQHHEAGRLRKAERLYRRVLESKPEHPDALHLLGVLASQARQFDAAVALINRAIEADGKNPNYHANLGHVLQTAGKLEEAIAAFERAIELEPELHAVHSNLGVALERVGRVDDALAAFQRALAINPDYATAHYNLGTAFKSLGKLEEAIAALRRAVAIDPSAVDVRANLAGYQLEKGDPGAALVTCDACLQVDPRHRLALTFKAIALDRLGRRDLTRFLVDLERFIESQLVGKPAGFSDLDHFNAALAHHVRTHPTLEPDPTDHATRFGKHTGNLLVEPKGPMATLENVINDAVANYLQALPADPNHPFLASRPQHWRLAVWAVVMERQGHQLPHTHPDAWISGVYYPKLPQIVNGPGEQQAGWIEFGRPLAEYLGAIEPEVMAVQPREGLLVLFPSYFYHRTIPFDTDEERISVAFDVVPQF